MIWPRLRKEAGIAAATLAALATYVTLEVIYLLTFGRFVILTGLPTPGGAPLEIHIANMGLKGAYAALVYLLLMRLWFGRIVWWRGIVLWAVGLLTVALLGSAATAGWLTQNVAANVGLAAFVAVSLFVARDWVAR